MQVKAEEAFAETARERKLREKTESLMVGRNAADNVDGGVSNDSSTADSGDSAEVRNILIKRFFTCIHFIFYSSKEIYIKIYIFKL